MVELSLEYMNRLADHLIVISSLLGGFSIAVIANLITYESSNRYVIYLLKAATIAAACFLTTVFSMTKILMMTTPGHPANIVESDLFLPKIIGVIAFVFGIISLSIIISLSGWTKSRRIGIFTTVVGVLTFLFILLSLVDIGT